MDKTNGGRRPTAREAQIRELLSEGGRDDLTVVEMAARLGIAPATLSWWRSELRRRDALRAGVPGGAASPTFLEVVVAAGGRSAESRAAEVAPAPFEVELRGGRVVRVPGAFGLARLVRELESC